MTRSQGTEVRRPSRRTVASGAAWAVPVIAVGAAAPAMAASPPDCLPTITLAPGSFKCCDGKTTINGKKNMKLVFAVTDRAGCLDADTTVCNTDVVLANNQPIGRKVGLNQCTGVPGTITVYLLDVQSCTVNLIVSYTVNDGADVGDVQTLEIKSENISSGNESGDCAP